MTEPEVQDLASETASDVVVEMPKGPLKNPMPETVQKAVECARDLCSIATSSVLEKNGNDQVVNNVLENLKNLNFQGQDLSELRFKYEGNVYSFGGLLEKLHDDSKGDFGSFKRTATELLRGTVFDENTRFDHDPEKDAKIKQFLDDISGEYTGGGTELVTIEPIVKWAGYDLVLPIEKAEINESGKSSGAESSTAGAAVTTASAEKRQIGAPQGGQDAGDPHASGADGSAGSNESSSLSPSAALSSAPEAGDRFKPLEGTQFEELVAAYKRWVTNSDTDAEDAIKDNIQNIKQSGWDAIPPRRLLLVTEMLEHVASSLEEERSAGGPNIYDIFSTELVQGTFAEFSREYPSDREVVRSQSNLDFLRSPEQGKANPGDARPEGSIEETSPDNAGATAPQSLRERGANLLSHVRQRLTRLDRSLATEPAIEGQSLPEASTALDGPPAEEIAQPAVSPDQAPNITGATDFKRMVESFPAYKREDKLQPVANINNGSFAIYAVEDGQNPKLHLIPEVGWADPAEQDTLRRFFSIEIGEKGSGYGLSPAIVTSEDPTSDSPGYIPIQKGTIWVPHDHTLVSN